MEELFEKYPWVEEMVETMGEEVRASGERLQQRALSKQMISNKLALCASGKRSEGAFFSANAGDTFAC
jgi:hypothetical protein